MSLWLLVLTYIGTVKWIKKAFGLTKWRVRWVAGVVAAVLSAIYVIGVPEYVLSIYLLATLGLWIGVSGLWDFVKEDLFPLLHKLFHK